MKKLLLLVLTIALVGSGAAVFLAKNQPSAELKNRTAAPNRVIMTANGFQPEAVTIKLGQTLNFVNQDTEPHWPASDKHPTHRIYPEFDPRQEIAPNQSWSFRFDRAGEWSFHDHLFPSFTGIITVVN